MNFGLIACPERMPRAKQFVSELVSAVTTLCEAADRVGNR
jgi:hypothetical protein